MATCAEASGIVNDFLHPAGKPFRMVTKTKKLLAAGFVLVIGLGLAWPFRRTEPFRRSSPALSSPAAAVSATVATTENGERYSSLKPLLDQPVSNAPNQSLQANESAFAVVSTEGLNESPTEIAAPGPTVITTVTEAIGAKPDDDVPVEGLEERIHVVHDGDSLERLAGRYLGDEGRALEIFDLNRDVLANPHWLPIGAEIRIPRGSPSRE